MSVEEDRRQQLADIALQELERERELLNTIVNGIPHLIVWTDRDLILRGCNEQYALAAGLDSPGDIVGRTVEQLPSIAQHAARYNQIDHHIIKTGIPALRLRETQKFAGGEERVVMMNRMPLRLRDNSVGGILVISEDVTEDERAAQKMRENEERWTMALEVNDVGVWDFDVLAGTVVGSRRWTELLNQPPDWHPQGIPLPEALVHADDLPRFTASWDALLLGTLPALEAGIRLRVGENYRYMRLRGRVVRRNTAGQALRVIGTMVDIHAAMLKQMQAANANKLESIGQLAAGVAHEINTPTQYVGDNVRFLGDAFESVHRFIDELTTLMGANGDSIPSAEVRAVLTRADIPYLRDEIPKAITQSLDGIKRIAQIVGAMKEFSHPGQERTPTDINHAITNTITVATNEWKYLATIVKDFDPAMPLVPVIPGEFNQVILNIIVNAAHAIGDARPGEANRKGTIRISTRHSGQWAEVRIEDDGCGMPPDVQQKIFDPFFTTKPVGKGTGQGLSIAHNVIVTKHRGSISVSSEPGRGTAFTIRVPLKLEELAENAA
jgi:two-component system, NtrC family, sensor kinase